MPDFPPKERRQRRNEAKGNAWLPAPIDETKTAKCKYGTTTKQKSQTAVNAVLKGRKNTEQKKEEQSTIPMSATTNNHNEKRRPADNKKTEDASHPNTKNPKGAEKHPQQTRDDPKTATGETQKAAASPVSSSASNQAPLMHLAAPCEAFALGAAGTAQNKTHDRPPTDRHIAAGDHETMSTQKKKASLLVSR